ncbi:MAG: type II toxin-antitoxin system PemK/MazF family toxin, partial [Nitrospina sp.]|nr:type II toxin-antitoxin system PemK/MazF family toxin [Nitrospina sp.]
MSSPQRGDIYWINLDPTIGAEIKKTRPCVIISPNV